MKVKVERGNRVFPVSDKASDVLKAFMDELKKLNVKIVTNASVSKILTSDLSADDKESTLDTLNMNVQAKKKDKQIKKVIGVEYFKDDTAIVENADKVILATGGNSYQVTGSTGDGYRIAEDVGHMVTDIVPSLVPVTANGAQSIESYNKIVQDSRYGSSLNLCKDLQGLSLRNVGITLEDAEKNKVIYEDFGEMLFTHFGVSGPTILSSTAHLLQYKNVHELLKCGKVVLKIDLKPALSEEKLDARILRDFEKDKNKNFKNSLNDLLPQKMIKPIIQLSGTDENKKVNEITKIERTNLVKLLKNFKIVINGFRPINEAIITSGGVSIKEINPKTMESKIVKNLYFAGEVIDVDAYTGGFNLQIAYSTGFVAGK